MGSSRHYSSADDEDQIANLTKTDAAGASPIPTQSDEAILAALRHWSEEDRRILRLIFAAVRELQRENRHQPHPDVPLRPDSTWVGTP
jgi:hypothetical protein